MIEISNLSKTYYLKNTTINALKDINITVADGEIFGVIGLSGAGKTTLLRSIASLEKIDQGKIIIDGLDISLLNNKNKRDFKKKIGIVFQGFNLLKQYNVYENVAFPLY